MCVRQPPDEVHACHGVPRKEISGVLKKERPNASTEALGSSRSMASSRGSSRWRQVVDARVLESGCRRQVMIVASGYRRQDGGATLQASGCACHVTVVASGRGVRWAASHCRPHVAVVGLHAPPHDGGSMLRGAWVRSTIGPSCGNQSPYLGRRQHSVWVFG